MKKTAILLAGLLPACGSSAPQPFRCAEPPQPTGFLKVDPKHVVPGRYFVALKPRVGGLERAAIQADALALEARYRLQAVRPLATQRAFHMRSDEATARALARDPQVRYVKPVTKVWAFAEPWGIDRVNQRALPLDGNTDPGRYGSGVHLAGIDTGVDCRHTQFRGLDGSSRCRDGYSTLGDDPKTDGNGHGTHTASTAAGTSFGILREATILPYKFLGPDGSGTDADAAEAIDHLINYKEQQGLARVVSNNSWGGPDSQPVNEGVCRATAAGIVFVAAAGNENLNACNYSPSRVDEALTVGATTEGDRMTSFSNTGRCIDLFAPGERVLGALPDGGSGELNGTSMAAPHVAGVGGLCLESGAPDPEQCVLDRATHDVLSGLVDSPNLLACTLEP
jgi:subtilisin family serine protease